MGVPLLVHRVEHVRVRMAGKEAEKDSARFR